MLKELNILIVEDVPRDAEAIEAELRSEAIPFSTRRLVRENKYDIPFILVTGSRSEEVAVECIREGADDYVLKTGLKRLPSSILNVLNKRAAEREKAKAE